MLLVYQIGTLISGFFGMAWGVVSAVVVIAVSFFQCGCPGRAANAPCGFSCQPCYTVSAIIYMVWTTMTANTSWFDRLIKPMLIMISFGASIILLLIAYYSLRKRTSNRQP